MKIAMIIPENLINVANQAASRFEENISVFSGTMGEGISMAEQIQKQGYDCIIARGGTKILISQVGLKIPVISIPITNIDIFHAVNEAEKVDDDITIVAFSNMMHAIESYLKISGKTIRVIQVNDEDEVNIKIQELGAKDKKVVIGGGIIKNFAKKHNVIPVVINSGVEAFTFAIEEGLRISQATRSEKEAKERIRAIIENTKDGIICVNPEGIISIFNKSAERMLGLEANQILRKKSQNVLPELEIEETIKSGADETDIIKTIRGTKVIFSKIVIKVNDETVNIVVVLKDIDEIRKLEETIRRDMVSTGHSAIYDFGHVIGTSPKIRETVRIGKEYGKVDSTVLIQGETGTGKEVIAQSIHNDSHRAKKPFVAVNCAAIPENLLESELFGYAPGAFTGADKKGKRGLFEIAQGGTIFLDEISEMHPRLQGRLLRVLQEKQIMRIGDCNLIPINVRVIAASNRDIYRLVRLGEFREDLYYRLNILRMNISPVRERKEDILCHLNHFIKYYCVKLGKEFIQLDEEVKEYLVEYKWPGNVREIRNFCERLCVMSKKELILLEDIKEHIFPLEAEQKEEDFMSPPNVTTENFKDTNFIKLEKKAIKSALIKSDGNITLAAAVLGISRTTIWRKMKKYNIIVSK